MLTPTPAFKVAHLLTQVTRQKRLLKSLTSSTSPTVSISIDGAPPFETTRVLALAALQTSISHLQRDSLCALNEELDRTTVQGF